MDLGLTDIFHIKNIKLQRIIENFCLETEIL